jgi:hypothetical protein
MHGIAATTCAPNHIDIFYLEPNFGMAHKSWDATMQVAEIDRKTATKKRHDLNVT